MLRLATHLAIAMLAIGGVTSQSVRAELVISSTAGTTYQAEAYATFATTSAEMVGMEVTVEFQNGQVDSQLWTATGINGNGWTMTHDSGSTFDNPFTLTNRSRSRVVRFTMHGAGSSTIFDRSVADSTPGTANGRDLQEYSTQRYFQDIEVTYFDQVQTIGSTPVGDIYAGMDVVFERGLSRNRSFIFRTDTDTTLNSISASVPEPTTAVTFAVAILTLGVRRRRRAGIAR